MTRPAYLSRASLAVEPRLPEHYRTKAGSRVTVTPGGGWTCNFDWFEEGACIEAGRCVDADILCGDVHWLHWACDCCGPRAARLFKCGEDGTYDVAALVEELSK